MTHKCVFSSFIPFRAAFLSLPVCLKRGIWPFYCRLFTSNMKVAPEVASHPVGDAHAGAFVDLNALNPNWRLSFPPRISALESGNSAPSIMQPFPGSSDETSVRTLICESCSVEIRTVCFLRDVLAENGSHSLLGVFGSLRRHPPTPTV